MSRPLSSDNLVRVLAGLLLAMFIYQAKCLCDRVEAVEKTQGRICVKLGIDPVAHESPKDWGGLATAAAGERNQENQKNHASQNNYEIFP
jgi:hypothetical protein